MGVDIQKGSEIVNDKRTEKLGGFCMQFNFSSYFVYSQEGGLESTIWKALSAILLNFAFIQRPGSLFALKALKHEYQV